MPCTCGAAAAARTLSVCPQCGQENPTGFRLCGMCGASLTAAEPTREVRKTVTIVFADVAGSTALGERLDPEATRRVMGRYFDEMRKALERHGGTVEKFIGDAVMAVFGIPQVREDDALRAVRAAADMRAALQRVNDELERDLGLGLRARIGVNTGEVVAGDPGSGQPFATGDAVNVAARLEQAAAPGEILLGDVTRSLAGDAVVVEPVEPLALKGKSESVAAWRLVDVLPDVPAFGRRIDTPFMGRNDELALLERAFKNAVDQRSVELVTVVGSPGLGKSRLAHELVGRVADARVLVGRCLPYGEGITYRPLAEVVEQLGGAAPASRLRELLAADDEAESVVEHVLGAVALSASAGSPEETAWAFRRLFEAVARERPLLLVVDDIHWAEPALLDLLEYLLSFSSGAPLLLLCLARADLFEARPSWSAPRRGAHTVVLDPLAAEESEALVERLLLEHELPASTRERVHTAAEGNPLFVEQLVAFYASAEAAGHAEAVPRSLQALLAARIDALESEERAVAERASVEGRTFHRTAVTELLPEARRPAVASSLMALVRKELIRPDRAEFKGDDGFRFGHILIRDAAYDAMPKLLRAELHERYAHWLERTAGERLAAYDEILGYHLEQACRLRLEVEPLGAHAARLAHEAGKRLASAGRRAAERPDMPAAAKLLHRAWKLLPLDELLRLEAGLVLATALWLTGELERADQISAEVHERAVRLGDERLRARARLVRLDFSLHPEVSMAAMRDELRDAIAIFEAAGDEEGLADAWRIIGMTHWMENRAGEQAEALTRALDHARRLGSPSADLAPILGHLATGLSHGPTPVDLAVAKCDELLGLAPGNLFVEGAVRRTRGRLSAMQGRFDEARTSMRRGISILEELGMTLQAAASAGQGGAFVEVLAGDLVEAERLARVGVETLRAAGERTYLGTTATVLADIAYRQGRLEEAERMALLAEEVSHEDDVGAQSQWRLVRAQLLSRQGRHGEAEALAREALQLTEATDFTYLRGASWHRLAEVLLAAGKRDEGRAAAERALALFEQKGVLVEAERVRGLLH